MPEMHLFRWLTLAGACLLLFSGFTILSARADSLPNLIQSVTMDQGALRITAQPNAALQVQDMFALSNPARLVVDLADAELANGEIALPASTLGSLPVNAIRVSKLDESAVRVVIETPNPQRLALLR